VYSLLPIDKFDHNLVEYNVSPDNEHATFGFTISNPTPKNSNTD
jgi:hypothetical protein